jgi:hypothetical protein
MAADSTIKAPRTAFTQGSTGSIPVPTTMILRHSLAFSRTTDLHGPSTAFSVAYSPSRTAARHALRVVSPDVASRQLLR